MGKNPKYKVVSRNLGLFDTVMAKDPVRYLTKGDTVELLSNDEYYRGRHADKKYYKVRTTWYEVGYVLSEGLKEVNGI